MQRILLTGATGLIGGAVLHQALGRDEDVTWVCLVRCANVDQGRQRVATRLARFTDPFTAQRLVRKIEIVPGDFTRADRDMDPRLDACTHVLHLAADTSWWGGDRVFRTNHDGTLALARRAQAMAGLQRFLHVGTAMICGADAPRLVEETAYPAAPARHIVGYTESKAATETALAEQFPDLPVVVARPSIVVGHSTLGAAPSSSILWVLRAADALRMLPCSAESCVDIVPTDWVAETLIGLLRKPDLAHDLYHLSSGTVGRTRWTDVIDAFEKADPSDGVRSFEQFDLDRDRSKLRKRFTEVFGLGDASKRTMLRATRAYYAFCALDLTFANDRLLAEGFEPAPPIASYLPVCLGNSGAITEQFADDIEMFASTPALSNAPAGVPLAATA